MPVAVCLLRGVNVGGHHKIRMETLRALFASLGMPDARTYVQSGNVVFRTRAKDMAALARKLESEFEKTAGFHSDVVLRTADEMRAVLAANPFAGRPEVEPNKLAVAFLAVDPGEAARGRVRAIPVGPEELHALGRELYIYFPEGMGRSKLPFAAIDKALGVTGTARNWNSVTALLKMAEEFEAC